MNERKIENTFKDAVIPFTKDAVKAYLDICIRYWRKLRDKEVKDDESKIAVYYIDAFQSVRTSIFGELLE